MHLDFQIAKNQWEFPYFLIISGIVNSPNISMTSKAYQISEAMTIHQILACILSNFSVWIQKQSWSTRQFCHMRTPKDINDMD